MKPSSSSLRGIKAIFLDAGGTLLHPYPSVGHIYSRIARRHGVHAAPGLLNQRFKASFQAHKRREPLISKKWWKRVVREAFADKSFHNWEKFFEDVYQEFARKRCWKVSNDALKALRSLEKQGLRLAVVSNWDARLPNLLKTMGLAPYFERQFISYRVGAAKPNPKIFHAALKGMRVSASEVIHVGDNEEEDLKAARRVGIRSRSPEIFGEWSRARQTARKHNQD